MAKYFFWIGVFWLYGLVASGQEIEKIDTDRPDQTESTLTVPAGWLQTEIGLVRTRIHNSLTPLNSWTLPTLTRLGLSEKWELRFIAEYERWGDNRRLFADTIGFLPMQLGFKVNLLEEKKLLPRTSLIAHLGFNRAASRFARGGSFFSTSARLAFQNSLSENVAIGYNFGIEVDDYREKPSWVYTFAPGINLTENLYAFVEAFGSFKKNDSPEHNIDAGFAWHLNDNNRLDIAGGFGISKAAPDYFFGIGFSCRFRLKQSDKSE